MTEFHRTVEIQAPVDRVWAVMRDIERWPEWTSTVSNIRRLDPGPLRVGSSALIRQPKLPPAKWKITDLDEARRSFTWVTRSPGVRVTARHWVEAPCRRERRYTLPSVFWNFRSPRRAFHA
jgi:uncharacterized membrane protein